MQPKIQSKALSYLCLGCVNSKYSNLNEEVISQKKKTKNNPQPCYVQKDKSPAETLQQEFTAGQMDERFNVIMSWTPYLLPSPVAVDLVVKCHKGS